MKWGSSILSVALLGSVLAGCLNDGASSDAASSSAGAASAAANSSTSSTPNTTAGPDVQAPTVPGNLMTTAVQPTRVDLSWTASTDNVGVTAYRILRNGTQVATSAGTSYSDTGLTINTSYTYTVTAVDAAGNASSPSASVTVRTPAVADTQPPSAPNGLAATASGTQISLSWTAATDNTAVTGYRVERCVGAACTDFAQIAMPGAVSHVDPALAANTAYRYRVRAADAAGNLSGYSNIASATTPAASPPSTVVPTLTRSTFMAGLSSPWDLAFLPDGTMFFTEKCRGLSVRLPNGTVNRLLGMGGTSGFPSTATDLFCEGQSGMHGVALDPDFANNRQIYVFSASNLSNNPRTNRVLRLAVNTAFTAVSGRADIVADIAFKQVGNAVGGSGAHSGGRIRFGPDGFLYVTTGDNHNPSLPQDPSRLGGKVLRVDRNGVAAPGNNAPAGFDPRIFTYGHRNVQGITFRPGTGQPYTAEHGPNHSDEVTALVAGRNAGWDPQNRSGLNCPDNYCGYAGTATTMPMTDTARFPTALPPAWTNSGSSQGMGPATFLSGAQWKAWDGRLAVSIMGGNRTDILELNATGVAIANANSGLPSARMRSLVQGPDGFLYVATDAGEIWRVVPN